MVKTICFCDRCQKMTEHPIALNFSIMDVVTRDLTEWSRLPECVELCEACAVEISNIVTSQPKAAAITQQEPEEDKKKRGRKAIRVDTGKIVALRKAGWKVKDIAEEIGLTTSQVSNVLYQEKKKLERENEKHGSND